MLIEITGYVEGCIDRKENERFPGIVASWIVDETISSVQPAMLFQTSEYQSRRGQRDGRNSLVECRRRYTDWLDGETSVWNVLLGEDLHGCIDTTFRSEVHVARHLRDNDVSQQER